MGSSGGHPDISMLRDFPVFSDLSDDQLALLAASLTVASAAKGTRVIARGSENSYSFFLLSGEVELLAGDGGRQRVSAGSESARNPLAQLLPRRYDVVATRPITYLELDSTLLENLRQLSSRTEQDSTLVVEEQDLNPDPDSDESQFEQELLAQRLRADLQNDRLLIPSLPEVALQIGRALNDKVTDAHRIAEIIQTDPPIAAKIVRAANSALYAGQARVSRCSAAVVRLGVNATHQLVLSFALREIFRARHPVVRRRLAALWTQHGDEDGLTLWPHRHGTDGFFMTRFVRR